jgi:hypothetical protein
MLEAMMAVVLIRQKLQLKFAFKLLSKALRAEYMSTLSADNRSEFVLCIHRVEVLTYTVLS